MLSDFIDRCHVVLERSDGMLDDELDHALKRVRLKYKNPIRSEWLTRLRRLADPAGPDPPKVSLAELMRLAGFEENTSAFNQAVKRGGLDDHKIHDIREAFDHIVRYPSRREQLKWPLVGVLQAINENDPGCHELTRLALDRTHYDWLLVMHMWWFLAPDRQRADAHDSCYQRMLGVVGRLREKGYLYEHGYGRADSDTALQNDPAEVDRFLLYWGPSWSVLQEGLSEADANPELAELDIYGR